MFVLSLRRNKRNIRLSDTLVEAIHAVLQICFDFFALDVSPWLPIDARPFRASIIVPKVLLRLNK
jgi:hypothetical protein